MTNFFSVKKQEFCKVFYLEGQPTLFFQFSWTYKSKKTRGKVRKSEKYAEKWEIYRNISIKSKKFTTFYHLFLLFLAFSLFYFLFYAQENDFKKSRLPLALTSHSVNGWENSRIKEERKFRWFVTLVICLIGDGNYLKQFVVFI